MVPEKIKQLIQTIIYQYDDVFIKRKQLILDKEYFISLPQEKQERMVRTSLIGDVSTLLGLLKDLYDLDTTTNKSKFYKFVHINRCDIGEFILEYGEAPEPDILTTRFPKFAQIPLDSLILNEHMPEKQPPPQH